MACGSMPVVAVVVPLACPSEDAATPKTKIQTVKLTQWVNITFLSSLRNRTFLYGSLQKVVNIFGIEWPLNLV